MTNKLPYEIDDNFEIIESLFPYPIDLGNRIAKLQSIIYDPLNNSVFDELLKIPKKYQDNVHLKACYATAYAVRGEIEKAVQLFEELVKLYPGYIYTRLNLAKLYIDEFNISKVLELMGKNFKLEELYPDRRVFYQEEVLNYFSVCVEYFLLVEDLETANSFLDKMIDINSASSYVKEAIEQIEDFKHSELTDEFDLSSELDNDLFNTPFFEDYEQYCEVAKLNGVEILSKEDFETVNLYHGATMFFGNDGVNNIFDDEDDLFDDEEGVFDDDEVSSDKVVNKNVGRNDPCPCGSGKKYKKCCL